MNSVVDPLTGSIDLLALAKRERQRERQRERLKTKEKITCTCGQEVTRGRLKDHEKKPFHKAESKAREMRELDYIVFATDSFLGRVMLAANLPWRKEATNHTKRRRSSTIDFQFWCPRWMHSLFRESWALTQGFDIEEMIGPYALFLKDIFHDEAKRDAVFAAKRMGGLPAVRSFVVTPKMRAAKLRRDADGHEATAKLMRAEAATLDGQS